MHRGRDLVVVAAVVLALLIAVARVGSERNREPSSDPRRSTYSTAPAGAHGFAAALERVGVSVLRHRQRLPRIVPAEVRGEGSTVFAVLGPTLPLDEADAAVLAKLASSDVDLLLAGSEAGAAMRCFGYGVRPKLTAERAATREPGRPSYPLDVHGVLGRARPRRTAESTTSCEAPGITGVDTLLRTEEGEPAAVRLELAAGTRVTLVADDEIFANRGLRVSAAAPFVLRLVAGRYDRLVLDEYDHGFGPSGRLDHAVMAWIRRTPWGWALVQLAGVGLVALLASGVRFGPARRVIVRRRRSPLEHVRALAAALAAARGHEVAVRLLVRGLQRRLARGGPAAGTERLEPAAWLAAVAPRLRTAPGRAAADRLLGMMQHAVATPGVLEAAELVETIWSDLTSASSPAMSSARPA